MRVRTVHDEIIIEGSLCHNCGEDTEVHLDGKKCPFEASVFIPMGEEEFSEAVKKLLAAGQFRSLQLVPWFDYKTVIV